MIDLLSEIGYDTLTVEAVATRMLLQGTPGLTTVGEAAHGAEAVRLAAELLPEVVLMDIRMPGVDGIEATRRIVAAGGRSRVLILTTFALDEYAHAGLRAGASGFLLKEARREELVAGIRAVASGDAVVSPRLTRRLLDAYAQQVLSTTDGAGPQAGQRLDTLSEREHEILVAVAKGWTNTEIAERLVLTESTVKKHAGRVLAKLGARDRVQPVIMAATLGWSGPAPEPRPTSVR